MKLLKLFIVLVVIIVAGYFFARPFLFGSVDTAARKAYWEQTLAAEIPVGSTRDQIQKWTQNHSVHLDELPQKHMLYIAVEKIPDKGLICSEWNITAEITMEGDKAIEENIQSAGTCL